MPRLGSVLRRVALKRRPRGILGAAPGDHHTGLPGRFGTRGACLDGVCLLASLPRPQWLAAPPLRTEIPAPQFDRLCRSYPCRPVVWRSEERLTSDARVQQAQHTARTH